MPLILFFYFPRFFLFFFSTHFGSVARPFYPSHRPSLSSPHHRCPAARPCSEQCLRRCIQETVAGAHFLCDRCAMKPQQLLSCSPLLPPSLLLPLPLSPVPGQLQQRAALFALTSPPLSADLWSTKDSYLTLATRSGGGLGQPLRVLPRRRHQADFSSALADAVVGGWG